jgi:hypothetical protein
MTIKTQHDIKRITHAMLVLISEISEELVHQKLQMDKIIDDIKVWKIDLLLL